MTFVVWKMSTLKLTFCTQHAIYSEIHYNCFHVQRLMLLADDINSHSFAHKKNHHPILNNELYMMQFYLNRLCIKSARESGYNATSLSIL